MKSSHATTGFHDPIQAKPKESKVKTPWNFEAPSYDDRNRICAGTDYGVGHRTPVGRMGNAKESAATLPKGRVNTLSVDRREESVEVK